MGLIQAKIEKNIGTIALDNYAKRNALSSDLIEEVLDALGRMRKDKVRAIVLRTVTNEHVWSAGHDVNELPQADLDPLPYSDPLEQLLRAVRDHSAPIIAMVHGTVWGGACDLIINCDLIIADKTSTFAITPAKLGLPYVPSGFLHFMFRLPLVIVKEMFFTGLPISAERAERAGLVNFVTSEDKLEMKTYEIAKVISSRSSESVSIAKTCIRMLSETSPISPSQFEYIHELRHKAYFGEDYKEGIQAFLEKRKPNFK